SRPRIACASLTPGAPAVPPQQVEVVEDHGGAQPQLRPTGRRPLTWRQMRKTPTTGQVATGRPSPSPHSPLRWPPAGPPRTKYRTLGSTPRFVDLKTRDTGGERGRSAPVGSSGESRTRGNLLLPDRRRSWTRAGGRSGVCVRARRLRRRDP